MEENASMHCSPQRNFHHPFEPYDIQVEFMNALYDCIEHKQVGIFESPTGTVGSFYQVKCLRFFKNGQLPGNSCL